MNQAFNDNAPDRKNLHPPDGSMATADHEQEAIKRQQEQRQKEDHDKAKARALEQIRQARIRRSPVGKAELEDLKEQRRKPETKSVLKPGGPGEKTVHETVRDEENPEREARIAYIKDRLGRQQNRARDGFNRGR